MIEPETISLVLKQYLLSVECFSDWMIQNQTTQYNGILYSKSLKSLQE